MPTESTPHAAAPRTISRWQRLLGWRARGDGTAYTVDPDTAHHGMGVRWRFVDTPAQSRIQAGIDPFMAGPFLVLLAGSVALLYFVDVFFARLVIAFFGLIIVIFNLNLLYFTPNHFRGKGPALRIDHTLGTLQVPGQPAARSSSIAAVECVSFVFASPGGEGGRSYTWGTHLVLTTGDDPPAYLVIARMGGNLKRTGRRLADRLNVPYRWNHLGVLDRSTSLPPEIVGELDDKLADS